MKYLKLLCLFVGLLGPSIVSAAQVNPYLEPITKRNVFNLGREQPHQEIERPLPTLTLHGIVALPTGRHALVRLGLRPNQSEVVSLWLREGEGALGDSLRVRKIDALGATVILNHNGYTQKLELK